MHRYTTLADRYGIHAGLRTRLPLPQSRETVLGFFASLQKSIPGLKQLSLAENAVALETDKNDPYYRWVVIQQDLLASGTTDLEQPAEALRQHELVFNLAPYHFSINHLDLHSLDVSLGFEFVYPGNHHELVAAALGGNLLDITATRLGRARIVGFAPELKFALDEEGRQICSVALEPRGTVGEICQGQAPSEPLGVWMALRVYGPFEPGVPFTELLKELSEQVFELADNFFIPMFVEPLARAIASR